MERNRPTTPSWGTQHLAAASRRETDSKSRVGTSRSLISMVSAYLCLAELEMWSRAHGHVETLASGPLSSVTSRERGACPGT